MPDYRWGILLAPQVENRKIAFGEHKGEDVWHEIPGEYRAMLRRLVVIQGDTEPASVEQQRFLGTTAPSLYDMRNLFQVNVEEGRHLWAMVYLLQKYFGRDGREEAGELLNRRSGDDDKPRMLGAFNESTPDWLSFFMFTVQRTCEAMREAGIEDPFEIEKVRALGVIDLPTLQKKANLHFSLSLDLFGSEISTNAANGYNSGLKGRFQEERIDDDHRLVNDTYPVLKMVDGKLKLVDEPALSALNMRLRDDYVRDCQGGINRWNRIISKAGINFEITLPSVAFHRHIGEFRDVHTTPEGQVLSDAEWGARRDEFLPTTGDGDYIASLMTSVREPGQFAGWISAPRVGIDNKPGDFEYVKIHD